MIYFFFAGLLLFGALLRWAARDARFPWLVTVNAAVLWGVWAVLVLWSPSRGSEGPVLSALYLGLFVCGSLLCGLFLQWKSRPKK